MSDQPETGRQEKESLEDLADQPKVQDQAPDPGPDQRQQADAEAESLEALREALAAKEREAEEAKARAEGLEKSHAQVLKDIADAALGLARRAGAPADAAAAQQPAAGALDGQSREILVHAATIVVLVIALAYGVPYFLLDSANQFPWDLYNKDLRVNAGVVREAAPVDGEKSGVTWRVRGNVTYQDLPAEGAQVSAVLTDVSGASYPSSLVGASGGNFDLALVQPAPEAGDRFMVDEIRVSASYEKVHLWVIPITYHARAVLQPEGGIGLRWGTASGAPFLFAIIIFVCSLVLGLVQSPDHTVWHRSRYYSLLLLGVVFSGAMIYFISLTIQALGGSANRDTAISLGFAHVYYGSYVSEAQPDWLLSLTTPGARPAPQTEAPRPAAEPPAKPPEPPPPKEPAAQSAAPASWSATPAGGGFGAPLWVLLLSVVGASVFTLNMVVEHLEKPVDFSDVQEMRRRSAVMIKHQFYILFSPLGAVFVYQLMVAAGSASAPITVALAALASGIALNAVLERAWKGVSAVVTGHPGREEGGKR